MEKQHLRTSTELPGYYILVRRWSGRLHDGLHVTCESSLHPHQHGKRSLSLQQLKPCHPPGRGAHHPPIHLASVGAPTLSIRCNHFVCAQLWLGNSSQCLVCCAALPAVLEAHLSSRAPSRPARGSPDQAERAAAACGGISRFSDLRAQLSHKAAWEEGSVL